MRKTILPLLLSLIVTANGCMFLGRGDYSVHVEGRVLDEAGNPIEGVAVSLFGSLTTTDKNGCFLYEGLTAASEYKFVLTKKGMQYISHTLPVEYYRINVVLKPERSTTDSVVDFLILEESQLKEGICSKA